MWISASRGTGTQIALSASRVLHLSSKLPLQGIDRRTLNVYDFIAQRCSEAHAHQGS
jgi:hypothetical protein